MTDTRDLDRLIGQTELTPITKRALRGVRRAVMTGKASDPVVGRYDWEVEVQTRNGTAAKFRFTLRKAKPNGSDSHSE